MHLTADTWAVVAATLAAALLGAFVAYIGSALQQRRQAARDAQVRRDQVAHDARIRLEAALAEVLAAAQDVLIGIRTIRQAHQRRTMYRYYIRLAGVIWHALPKLTTWRDLIDYPAMRSLLGAALDLDREITEGQRTVAIDMANVVAPRLNRYFAVAALLTLGEDKKVADAIRLLTPKVTALADQAGAKKRNFERLSMDMQKALERFRSIADECIGNER